MEDFELIYNHEHFCPHLFLGLHENRIRVFNPGFDELVLIVNGKKVKATLIDKRGLFEFSQKEGIKNYQIPYPDKVFRCDPYFFDPVIEKKDIEKFKKGIHYKLYDVLGAHKKKIKNVSGIQFSLWAPNAKSVSVVGDFNNWDKTIHQMKNVDESGIWAIFISEIGFNELYKFEIFTKDNNLRIKTDPFAFYTELRPHNSAIVFDVDNFSWNDEKWMSKRKKDFNKPVNIYEVHLQSWKMPKEGYFLNYKKLAHMLMPYLKEMGYNYIEILPIMEHPLDDSWGYQVSNFFAITSRYGNPKDFQYFVDYMHQNDIGVILDWVPAHFPVDDFALHRFDGTYLFEHNDPKRGFHPQWNTFIFEFGNKQVENFLIASALFYLDKYHIDALRVDAVSSLLYLDFARKKGEWTPNKFGGNENLEAIEFIKHLNKAVKDNFTNVLMIAEEASPFKGVTDKNGLNFDYKWNMGWMTDTLKYFQTKSEFRKKRQGLLTFSLMYAFDEKFILPFSHDEVVHEKNSFFGKMPFDNQDDKFSNLKLLYSYMMCHPGKKLNFMGIELATKKEWDNFCELDWDLLKNEKNKKFNNFVKDINHLYLNSPALYQDDLSFSGFSWVDFEDEKNSVISFIRISKTQKFQYFCIFNFSKNILNNYSIKKNEKFEKIKKLILNTDEKKYGGKGLNIDKIEIKDKNIILTIPSYTALIFEVEK
ncbi:MAG: 1,4-alpha-glucan branching protein GlgB, partial [Parachlamydiales bacterium]|nr:1,4-alpha-glucan branching protein GlgB [Parachlamydiales bacterium]